MMRKYKHGDGITLNHTGSICLLVGSSDHYRSPRESEYLGKMETLRLVWALLIGTSFVWPARNRFNIQMLYSYRMLDWEGPKRSFSQTPTNFANETGPQRAKSYSYVGGDKAGASG